MRVILFTNARDEKHIKEWVAHHLNLGFDFIHIFDHKSIEPIAKQFKPNPKLKIEEVNFDGNIKRTCMELAIVIAKQYNWMIYLDSDEFMVLNNHNIVHDFIKSYKNVNQIGLNWIFFGTNYLTMEPNGMIIENYIRCNSKINKHVKSFIKPSAILEIYNAHSYKTSDPIRSISCYNSIPMDIIEPWFVTIPNKSYADMPGYIAHYVNQSYSVYMKRRINRKRDNDTKLHKIYTEEELHTIDNDIINTEVRDKYCHQNAELMKTL